MLKSEYHEQFILPNNVIDNYVTSDKSLDGLTDEIKNKIEIAINDKTLISIKGTKKAQLFDPRNLIVFEIEKIK